MNCREFENQFEENFKLNSEAKAHLKNCEECETFRSETVQLTQMISSLPSVEAPKDFEFGFRSKLAAAQLKRPLSPIWQFLRYALPATAAALIFGFVFVNSNLLAPSETPQVAEQKETIEQNEMPLNEESFTRAEKISEESIADNKTKLDAEIPAESVGKEEPIEREIDKPSIIAENKPKVSKEDKSDDEKIITRDIIPNTDSPKVIDEAFTITKPINPPGINPDKKIDKKMPQSSKTFTAKAILSQLGIETTSVNGQLKVTSVRKNSVGQNSGVQIGDFITAIDGQKLSDQPMQDRTVQGKTLKLRRGGRDLYIVIKN